jgi:hypothetical protein
MKCIIAALSIGTLFACFRTNEASTVDGGKDATASPSDVYVLDLSVVRHAVANSLDPREVGLPAGSGFNFALPIRLEQKTWSFPTDLAPGVPFAILAGQDGLTAGCDPSEQRQHEKSLSLVTAGTRAWVESADIDVEFVEFAGDPAVCFGYRDADGARQWHWEYTAAPMVQLDAATRRYHGHLVISKGPIDAVKLVFDASGRGFVPRVTFLARPMAAGGDR